MSATITDSNTELPEKSVQLRERIRQQVDNRHWELFEARLKYSSSPAEKENYTKSNGYDNVEYRRKTEKSRLSVEPNQRWQTFCSQLTSKSNETDRVMSIFRHVWINNWNGTERDPTNVSNENQNSFLKRLSLNEHDKKVISSILHKT